MHPTALIAEDEPLLAAALRAELTRIWPELHVLACVGDGLSAVQQALALRPDVLFFDIRMPGLSGLDAAAELADQWDAHSTEARAFPALVFVTAFDQYAVQAFEAQAVDYLLKPVQTARLQKTVDKLRANHLRATHPSSRPVDLEPTLHQLRHLLGSSTPASAAAPLRMIAANLPGSGGASLRMVPVDEVLAFDAADKYVRVLTAQAEYLIRTPLKELLAQLDTQTFWQIHRSTAVRVTAIDTVTRDDTGKLSLTLHGHTERWVISRIYAHLFRAM